MFIFGVYLRMILYSTTFLGSFANDDVREKMTLKFSYITTLTGDFVSSGGIPIVDKALQEINNRSDILENYTLSYTEILDSKCSRSHALESFFKHFTNASQPTYVSLLCCGCSVSTIPVAEISYHWNVPHVAFASAASVLKDRERFKSFFGALPSLELSPLTYAQLMKQFGWRQMAIVTQQETLFTKLTDSLQTIFEEKNWILGQTDIESNLEEFPYNAVFDMINDGNYRLVVLNTYGEYAVKILCEAYHRGMKYPQYTFFTLGSLADEWWEEYLDTNSSCPYSMIAAMVNGSSVSIVPNGYFPNGNEILNTTSGEEHNSFIKAYHHLLEQPHYASKNYSKLGIVGVAYDSIWSIAYGLDKASKKVAAGNDSGCGHLPGDLVPLEEFDYLNEKMGCVLKTSMDEVLFAGITGQFHYVNGSKAEDTRFFVNQHRLLDDGKIHKVLIAEVYHSENRSNFTFVHRENTSTVWGQDEAPYDGSTIKIIIRNSLPLRIIYYMAGLAGLVFTLVCLVFNIYCRDKKIVKLSSPNLNYLILVGTALLYSDVFLYVSSVDSFSEVDIFTSICNLRFLMFTLGYTMCFAVVLSKQWRIYYIFNNPTSKKKTIKDWSLFLVVIITVAIDLFIVSVGTAVPQSRLEATVIKSDIPYSTSANGERQENFVLTCDKDNSYIWLLMSFIYKGCLQVLAIFMAFHTRKVKIRALNDSKEIMAIIYTNSIILALLTVTEFGLKMYYNVYSALFGLALLIEGTLFLGLVFIPKMVSLYFDPNGEKIFSSSINAYKQQQQKDAENHVHAKAGIAIVNSDIADEDNNVASLKARIEELEGILNKMNHEESEKNHLSVHDKTPDLGTVL